jgi:hypothetical protein
MIYMRLCVFSTALLLVFCGVPQAQDAPHIGLKIRTLTPDLRKQHTLGADIKGALVTGVTAGSSAQRRAWRWGMSSSRSAASRLPHQRT